VKIAVTGARGFIARHVLALLRTSGAHEALPIDRATPASAVRETLAGADAIIHLAGINRPRDEHEFTEGNVDLTRAIVDVLKDAGSRAPVVFSSTSRALENTPYGRSKLAAEDALRAHASDSGSRVTLFRLPNVFGKWSRPNYNSAVATFCHAIARDEPVDIHDSARTVCLVYSEDVARELIAAATRDPAGRGTVEYPTVEPQYERTLGDLVALIREFRAMRTALLVPDLGDDFTRKLYGTYVSFLPLAGVSYPLRQFQDERGALAELLKSPRFGQIFVSRTRPGITRGNHFHHTKTEKFVVVEGDAVIRMRGIEGDAVAEIAVRGSEFRVVDIPTGYTHSITNVGSGELVTLFWASEIFDPSRPDTYPLDV
jgi:UDP-2-acetamido-2,6-beta-L-arabino-hexul-4-ose reductase